MRSIFFIVACLAVASRARGQQSPAAPPKSPLPIVVRPSARNTEVVINPGESDDEPPPPPAIEAPANAALRRWARPSGGLWLSVANFAVVKSNFHISSDEVLYGNASEWAFGLGGQLDFALPGSANTQGLRLRAGLQRVSITPSPELLKTYSAAQLENSAKTLVLTGLYRMAPDFDLGYGTFWCGAGVQLNHAFSTDRPGQGGQAVSSLKSSYSFSVLGAFGLDIPYSDTSDVGVELDWRIIKGLGGLVSLRSSL